MRCCRIRVRGAANGWIEAPVLRVGDSGGSRKMGRRVPFNQIRQESALITYRSRARDPILADLPRFISSTWRSRESDGSPGEPVDALRTIILALGIGAPLVSSTVPPRSAVVY